MEKNITKFTVYLIIVVYLENHIKSLKGFLLEKTNGNSVWPGMGHISNPTYEKITLR